MRPNGWGCGVRHSTQDGEGMTEVYELADPHGFLGAHAAKGGVLVRVYRPDAESVRVLPMGIDLAPAVPVPGGARRGG